MIQSVALETSHVKSFPPPLFEDQTLMTQSTLLRNGFSVVRITKSFDIKAD